ncbi:MAG: PQQ-binding-like beta-propeller repeat protein [Thermoleophilia bacterium]
MRTTAAPPNGRSRGRHARRALAATAAAALLALGLTACGGDDDSAQGTSGATTSGAAATGQWAYPNGDIANTRVAQGTNISSQNVTQLNQAWTHPLNVKGTSFGAFAAMPVVQDGVVYLQDLGSNVFALDLETGALKWEHKVNLPDVGPNGVAVADGKVFAADPKSAFALDAATGEQVWSNDTLVGKGGVGFTIQPQVADGRVYISTATQPGGGIAYALDENTGKKLWSFATVIDNAKQDSAIGSGGAWNTPLVGTDGSVSYGIGNPYQPPANGISNPGKRLYTDSTVNLDAATGKLRWYYQGVTNDFYDWDMQLSPIATTVGGSPAVLDAGKMGYVYAMDAATGKLIWKTPVGVHNGHDNDSAEALAGTFKGLKVPADITPGIYGGVETNMAVDDGVVYAAVVNLPVPVTNLKKPLGTPDFSKGTGEMVALDLETGKQLWSTTLPTMPFGAATVSNDLVWTTLFNGNLVAFSREDGSIVHQIRLPAASNAPIAIAGDTIITAAGFPQGKGQVPEVVAYRIGATPPAATAPETTSSTATAPSTTTAQGGGGGTAGGKQIFAANCASCHTLADANATGTVGPDLDQLKPEAATVQLQVTNGGGGMPSFDGTLSAAEIQAVADYVAQVAGKGGGGGGGGAPTPAP